MSDNQDVVSGAPATAVSPNVPQFATAEYAHIPGTERCRFCGGAVSGEYFRVNNQMACSKCGAEAKAGQPTDSHVAFARALALGAGAAVLGMSIYAGFVIATGISLGYLALAVGWLVAKGMMKGSNGVGGTRYQIVAVVLTYLAISMAAIPIAIGLVMKSGRTVDWGAHIDTLLMLGIASPFMAIARGRVLTAIIVFVGLSIAFRLTAAKPMAVDGPFPVGA